MTTLSVPSRTLSSILYISHGFLFRGFRFPRISNSFKSNSEFITLSLPRTHSSRTMASAPAAEAGTVEKNIKGAPYGSWKSPITADVVSGAEKRLGGLAVNGAGRLCWVESRPTEAGRAVLVKESEESGDKPIDVTPEGFAVRSSAQEYGGGSFTVSRNMVIFSNYKDQRLYKQFIGVEHVPVPLTPDYGGPVVRYADGVADLHLNRYITVREDHRESSQNPTTTIVAVDLSDENLQEPKILVSGNDFYAFPRLDQNGKKMAWVEWGHPNMHWDKAELWVGYISENGDVYNRICVAGGDATMIESPTEPKWSSKGELLFVTDRKCGFWNLYKWIEGINELQALCTLDAEFTRPLWVFGFSSYDFIQNSGKANSIICTYRQNGRSYLGILDDVQNHLSLLDIPFTDINNVIAGPHCLYIEGASPVLPLSIARLILDETESQVIEFSIIWSSSPDSVKYKSYFSLPEIVEFPTEVPGQNAYAYFYPPSNHTFQAGLEERPPLLLRSHGGPTAEARGILDLSIQYWTSRGWAFADVNYGGSTGYGREKMEGSSALGFSSLKTHFSFNLYNSCSSPKHTLMITFHPKHPQITGFEGKNHIFLSPPRRSLLLAPSFAIAEALKQSASPSLNKKEALSKVDNNGRFCSPRAARELALSIVYASCLEGTDPVRLFDKRLNEKRFPGYVFDKASLLEYDHMSFAGAPIALETEEEAEELLHNNEKESLIEEEVLSAPLKLVYNKFVLRLTRDILEAVVDKWDRHVHVIDKITPPNWKNEPASRILELCLLHLAMSEITAVGTRYQIVINETVDLAKRFCDGTAPRIINGCLRTFVKNYSETEIAQPSEGKS